MLFTTFVLHYCLNWHYYTVFCRSNDVVRSDCLLQPNEGHRVRVLHLEREGLLQRLPVLARSILYHTMHFVGEACGQRQDADVDVGGTSPSLRRRLSPSSIATTSSGNSYSYSYESAYVYIFHGMLQIVKHVEQLLQAFRRSQ